MTQSAAAAIKAADNGKYDYANMKSQNKNIQAIHDAKNEELKSERVKEIEKQRKGEVVYTLFASGLNHGGRNVLLDDADFTSNIVIIFDDRMVTKLDPVLSCKRSFFDSPCVRVRRDSIKNDNDVAGKINII